MKKTIYSMILIAFVFLLAGCSNPLFNTQDSNNSNSTIISNIASSTPPARVTVVIEGISAIKSPANGTLFTLPVGYNTFLISKGNIKNTTNLGSRSFITIYIPDSADYTLELKDINFSTGTYIFSDSVSKIYQGTFQYVVIR